MTQTVPLPGIRVDILGCSDPFSKTGRSSAYRVQVAGKTFLVDCGAPIFSLLSFAEIAEIDGVIITHSHDDHRRWLTDLALFRFYVCRNAKKLKLITTYDLQAECKAACTWALERSLSADSSRVVDMPFGLFFDPVTIGQRPKYRIATVNGEFRVVDLAGREVPADRAKAIVHPVTNLPRMLFCDPETTAWVEPEIFYAQRSSVFYEPETNDFIGEDDSFRIRAVKSHAWHGLPVAGVIIETESERVIFSSDTAYNPDLFRQLTEARFEPTLGTLGPEQFAAAPTIKGDINDFLMRSWSDDRLHEALFAYTDAVVFHDAAAFRSVVHTDYKWTSRISGKLVLVHTPDRFATTEVLGQQDKTLRVVANDVCEQVDETLVVLDADVYLSVTERYFVGYRDDAGDFAVVHKENNVVDVVPAAEANPEALMFRVRMFEDIGGHYFPRRSDLDGRYARRPDGKVEWVTYSDAGSAGTVVEPIARRPARAALERKKKVRRHADTGILRHP